MRKIKFLPLLLILFISEAAQAQSAAQLKEILEQFCLENYDSYFNPRQYVANSLKITDIQRDGSTIYVEGTHSYRGPHVPIWGRTTFPKRGFKATLKPYDEGYKIEFWRWHKSLKPFVKSYWDGPCKKYFEPD